MCLGTEQRRAAERTVDRLFRDIVSWVAIAMIVMAAIMVALEQMGR
jgi:hypothetical protein